DENEVRLALDRQLSAVAMRDDDPDAYIAVLASRNFYRDHPYQAPPDGLKSTLETVTPEGLRAHHGALLNRNRLKLFVMGNLDRVRVEQAVRAGLASLRIEPFDWPRVAHTPASPP